jgi:hypothetical protein
MQKDEEIDMILLSFAREIFGDSIPIGLDDPKIKECIQRYRDEIMELYL